MTVKKDIKEAMKAEKIVIGFRSVVREVKNGKLTQAITSRNLPESMKRDLEHYRKVSKMEVNEFPGNSLELGEVCGKPFAILAVGIRK